MSESGKKRLSAVVHGMVQGVGFRYFVQRSADSAGVTGWVKNLPDGSVASVAEGLEHELELFLEALQRGPSFSRVSKVDAKWGDYQDSFSSFDITF